MPTSRTDRAADIFDQAADLLPEERRAFLAETCGSDNELRKEVEALLSADDTAGAFLSNPQFNPADAAVRVAGSESPGSRIGHYKLIEMIGEGGFGSVFLAEQDRPVKRRVALKIIKLGMDTRQVIARFEAERQALAMMDHPNIARVLDASATDTGRPYFVMELVRGVMITRYCRQYSLPLKERLRLFIPVCQAVQHAHQKGIIHRDLKPSNVLITLIDGQPVPKIIDFGIAKATQQRLTDRTMYTEFHSFLGTPAYMSPEQASLSGDDVDTRSDVYSLGVMLYELLTGTTPFDPKTLQNATYAEVQKMIREVEPPRPSTRVWTMRDTVQKAGGVVELNELRSLLRGELDWIVMKCLEKQRSRRYESASALGKDLEAFLAGKPVTAAPPSRVYQARKFIQQHSFAIGSTAAVMTALAIALGIALFSLQRLRVEQARTLAEKQESERQRQDAQTSRDAAAAVNEFINDMLASADPETARGGKPVTVEEVLQGASEKIGKRFADQPLVEAGIRDTIGRAYASLDNNELASQNLQLAEELRRAQGIAGDPRYLSSRAELALTLHSAGKFEPSRKLFVEVVEEAEKQLQSSDRDIVPAVDVLARSATYIAVPNEKLEPLFKMAFERRRQLLGEDDPATLVCQSSYGWYAAMAERPAEAEAVLRETLARMQRVLGPAEKFTLKTQDRLGSLIFFAGRKDEGLAIKLATAEAAQAAYGYEHPLTLTAWERYADLLERVKRFEEALALEEKRFAALQVIYGSDSPSVSNTLFELARLHEALGNYDRMLELQLQRLELNRRLYGENGMQTIFNEASIGEKLARLGRYAEALVYFERSVPRLRAQLRRESPRLAEIVDRQARALYEVGRKEESLKLCDELLATVAAEWDRATPAIKAELFRRTATAATIQARVKGPVAAEPTLRLALERLKQTTIVTGGGVVRDLLEHLANACDETGKPEEAAELRRRAASLQASAAATTQSTTAPSGGTEEMPSAPE